MKKILVSGYIGFNNFGDEAIFYALSNHLKQQNMDVGVLCGNTKDVSKKYNVRAFYYKNPLSVLGAILNTDILISGGGSLLQNKTSNFSLYYYLLVLLSAKLFFKKTIIFAQGIEPVKGKFSEFFLKRILKTIDYISVRDDNSRKYLEKLGIKSTLVPDCVYSILQETKISDKKEGLVIQLRKTKNINREFVKNLAKIISKYYKEKLTGNIRLMSLQDDFDREISEKLQNEFKILNIDTELILQTSIEDTINIINNSKFVIAARLHGVIVANALKTRTFALNYDEKLKTLTQELSIQNIDLENFSCEELNKKLEIFFNFEEEYTQYRRFDWNDIDNVLSGF